MSKTIKGWMLGLAMIFGLAGVYTPPAAQAQVVVRVGPRRPVHHRHVYYRHGHRYYR